MTLVLPWPSIVPVGLQWLPYASMTRRSCTPVLHPILSPNCYTPGGARAANAHEPTSELGQQGMCMDINLDMCLDICIAMAYGNPIAHHTSCHKLIHMAVYIDGHMSPWQSVQIRPVYKCPYAYLSMCAQWTGAGVGVRVLSSARRGHEPRPRTARGAV